MNKKKTNGKVNIYSFRMYDITTYSQWNMMIIYDDKHRINKSINCINLPYLSLLHYAIHPVWVDGPLESIEYFCSYPSGAMLHA